MDNPSNLAISPKKNAPKKNTPKKSPKIFPNSQNIPKIKKKHIQFPTSHLEAENPFRLLVFSFSSERKFERVERKFKTQKLDFTAK